MISKMKMVGIAGGLLGLIVVAVGADRHGYNRAMDRCEAERAEAIEKAIAQRDAQARTERAIARQVITDEQEIRDQTELLHREAREHARTADNPVCFDDDRMQRIRQAIHPD